MSVFCWRCSQENSEGTQFCSACDEMIGNPGARPLGQFDEPEPEPDRGFTRVISADSPVAQPESAPTWEVLDYDQPQGVVSRNAYVAPARVGAPQSRSGLGCVIIPIVAAVLMGGWAFGSYFWDSGPDYPDDPEQYHPPGGFGDLGFEGVVPDESFQECLNEKYLDEEFDFPISEDQLRSIDADTISCVSREIISIEGVQYLERVTKLNFDYNQLSDISLLSEVPNLESLSLKGNQIQDLTPLIDLPNLGDALSAEDQEWAITAGVNTTTDLPSVVGLEPVKWKVEEGDAKISRGDVHYGESGTVILSFKGGAFSGKVMVKVVE